jgi:hypothetical protein
VVLRACKGLEMESEEEGFMLAEGSSGSKHMQQKTSVQPPLGRTQVQGLALPDGSANAYPLPWMQPPQSWLPPHQLPFINPWMMGGQPGGMSFANLWMVMPHTADVGPRQESVDRANRRHKRREYEAAAVSKTMGGHKPNKLRIKEGGDINGGCLGKNAWDGAVRSLVPRILDMSIID